VSDKLLQRGDLLTGTTARDWAAIGAGLAAAFALVAIFLSGVWALLVLVSA